LAKVGDLSERLAGLNDLTNHGEPAEQGAIYRRSKNDFSGTCDEWLNHQNRVTRREGLTR
jgi:hypothetical protein